MGNTTLTSDEMMAVFVKHATAEFAKDIDTTMETVAEHPVFEWAPLNLRIEGRDAVRKMYTTLLERNVHKHILSLRALAFGDGVIVVEYVITIKEDGHDDLHTSVITVLGFDGDKIAHERTFTHPDFTAHLREGLGDDFEGTPGVSGINYEDVLPQTSPVPWYQPAAGR